MHGMREAVERIRQALLAHEPILIYGDYDVDGTVATVLLKTAIERTAAALAVTPDIRYHIPHRILEGYGMRESRIVDAAQEGVRLVISVDTGIRAHAAAEEAARLSLDLIDQMVAQGSSVRRFPARLRQSNDSVRPYLDQSIALQALQGHRHGGCRHLQPMRESRRDDLVTLRFRFQNGLEVVLF